MAKVIKWTEKDVTKLFSLISERGKSEAIKEFAAMTGRTEDGVRRKVNRVLEEAELEFTDELESLYNDEKAEYDPDFDVEDPDFDALDEPEEKVNIFKRIWRWLTFQC